MRKLTLIVTFLAIIAFGTAVSFLFTKFSSEEPTIIRHPSTTYIPPTHIKTQTPTLAPTSPQTTSCQQNQVKATISTQGAAGNIYGTLEMTNTGKSACEIELGNTVIATFDNKSLIPQNIAVHNVHTVPVESYLLVPGAKVYSQVHYPNGPQCQSGIKQIYVSFLVDQTGIIFQPDAHTENLVIQACKSDTEKTTVDIWPLSKSPITP